MHIFEILILNGKMGKFAMLMNIKKQILLIFITFSFASCLKPSIYYIDRSYNIKIDDFEYKISDSVKNGYVKVFDAKDSTIRYEGRFKNYRKTGIWKEYYSNRLISYRFRYKNGYYEGVQKSWYNTGKQRIIWVSKDGIVKRVLKCYNSDGEKISFEEFKDWQY